MEHSRSTRTTRRVVSRRSTVARQQSTAAREAICGKDTARFRPKTDVAYDEYIHNLQQQVYFLELEAALKAEADAKRVTTSGSASVSASGTASAAGGTAGGGGGVSSVGGGGGAHSVSFDGEFGGLDDIFAQFKGRYATMEKQYKEELTDARNLIDALRSQVEAHGGLVIQLKDELARQRNLQDKERTAWAEQHEATALKLTTETRLYEELTREFETLRSKHEASTANAAEIEATLKDDIAQLRAQLQSSAEEAQSLAVAQQETDHQLHVREDEIKDLRRALEEAEAKLPPLEDVITDITTARDAAIAAQRKAEISQKAMETTMRTLQATVDEVNDRLVESEGEVQRLESTLYRVDQASERRAMAREESDTRLLLSQQAEYEADRARKVAERATKDAQGRASDLSRQLISVQSTLESTEQKLRAADEHGNDVDQQLSDLAAVADQLQARLDTISEQLRHTEVREKNLSVALDEQTEARTHADAELARARRELQAKPNTEPLQQIDFNTLLQSNIQAASTIEAFVKESQEKEAKARADEAALESSPLVQDPAGASGRTSYSASVALRRVGGGGGGGGSSSSGFGGVGVAGGVAGGFGAGSTTASGASSVSFSQTRRTFTSSVGASGAGVGGGAFTFGGSGSASGSSASSRAPRGLTRLGGSDDEPTPQPLAVSPTRSSIRPGDARSQLLGHAGLPPPSAPPATDSASRYTAPPEAQADDDEGWN